ncbi:MAG: RsiV family protein [Muribaculaceae bacterium]|nr:RsiV family protein [Muribaculaceae bacterium]
MKALSISIAGALAIAALCATSCSNTETATDTITLQKIEVQRSYRLAGSADDYLSGADLSYGCQAELIMPVAIYGHSLDALRDTILSAAVDSTGADIEAVLAGAMPRIAREVGYNITDTVLPDSLIAAVPRFLPRYDGFYSAEGDIETLSPRYLSYAVTRSSYQPSAAHGNYGTVYINYDLNAGCLITLHDLFTAEGLEALPEIIRDTAVKMQAAIGNTDIAALPAGGNFYLTPESTIVFAYQPYEVASYAQGEIQIPIPAYLLSEYLTPVGTALLL